MRRLRAILLRLAGLFGRRRLEREMAEELAAHLDLHTEENIRAGMRPREARRQALIKLGGIESAREAYRDRAGLPLVENAVRDVRYALRSLRRNPGFAAAAILTLGLCIGINTAIFSLIELIAFRPLPVPEPERLVLLQWNKHRPGQWTSMNSYGGCDGSGADSGCSFPYPLVERFRMSARSLGGVAAFGGAQSVQYGVGEAATGAAAELVNGEFFSTLGVRAHAGRTFLPGDDRPGAEPAVVLNHAFWREQFGADPAAVGRTIPLNGAPFRIIGVAPPEFHGLQPVLPPNFWITLHGARALGRGRWYPNDEHSPWLFVIGRLAPGVTLPQARAELEVIFHQGLASGTSQQSGSVQPGLALTSAAGGLSVLRRGFLPALQILAVAAGLILLIGCANIAGLLVARAAARGRELATRVAIGAGRRRLAGQLLTEGVVLVALGGGLGALLAWPLSQLLAAWIRFGTTAVNLNIDVLLTWPVAGFTLAAGGLAVLLFGLVPGLMNTRVAPAVVLKGGAGAAHAGRHGSRLGRMLVAAETALAVVLLAGAGLFLRTLINLKSHNPGFNTHRMLTVETSFKRGAGGVGLQASSYPMLRDRLESVPGITSATWGQLMLIGNTSDTSLPGPGGSGRIEAYTLAIGPRFFETLEIPLLAGRSIRPEDCRESPGVVWINRALARRYFPGGGVLGQRIGEGGQFEIVGVAGDTQYQSLRSGIQPTLFMPAASGTFLLRAAASPATLEPAVLRAFKDAAPGFRPGPLRSLDAQIDQQLFAEHMLARLSSGFGALALLLAAIGVYGVMAYSVTRRTNEIAIRVSLGARPGEVARLVLLDGLPPVLAGVLAGLVAAGGLTRLVASFLFGVEPLDPVAYAGAAVVLLGAAALACGVPLGRALRVDPAAALRCE